ncbi:MAG: hypothetical protein GYB37_05300 [Algicola sp.]|nr:hypothetical protein [Algicola sp.]
MVLKTQSVKITKVVAVCANPKSFKTYLIIFWNDPLLDRILAYFGDEQFTVRIDRLRSGEIRYLCWHNKSSILGRPKLILRHGQIKESSNSKITEFIFHHDGSTYTVEHVASKIKGGINCYFIEVMSKDQKKSTWKMNELTIPKYLLNL